MISSPLEEVPVRGFHLVRHLVITKPERLATIPRQDRESDGSALTRPGSHENEENPFREIGVVLGWDVLEPALPVCPEDRVALFRTPWPRSRLRTLQASPRTPLRRPPTALLQQLGQSRGHIVSESESPIGTKSSLPSCCMTTAMSLHPPFSANTSVTMPSL